MFYVPLKHSFSVPVTNVPCLIAFSVELQKQKCVNSWSPGSPPSSYSVGLPAFFNTEYLKSDIGRSVALSLRVVT
jgi:hypothetical protein